MCQLNAGQRWGTSGPALPARSLLARRSWPEVRRIGDILRAETVGGVLLVAAAAAALVWANPPWGDAYKALSDLRVGPVALHRELLHQVQGLGR